MLMTSQKELLRKTVQRNCDISDAHYAANYTMCVYLLKMREFFRWENGYSYNDSLPKDEIGNWVQERELFWEKLENKDFMPLSIDGEKFHPFDTEKINKALVPKGIVYSGGMGLQAAPHFFLAKLESKKVYKEFTIYISANEYARDLTAPPAMTQGKNVFIRKESLRRFLWEKFQEWQWNKYENAMAKAFSYYEFEQDIDKALDEMTENELEAVALHEIGEFITTTELGNRWHEMVIGLPRSRVEIMVRAVKDLLSDCLSTLPALIENYNSASLHFYAGNLVAMRKELFPSFQDAYQSWVESNNLKPLKILAAEGVKHWSELAYKMLDSYEKDKENCLSELELLVEQYKL